MMMRISMNDHVSLPSCRQCALVALQDVKAYLEEGGQIAVSPSLLPSVHLSLHVCLRWLVSKMPRCPHLASLQS